MSSTTSATQASSSNLPDITSSTASASTKDSSTAGGSSSSDTSSLPGLDDPTSTSRSSTKTTSIASLTGAPSLPTSSNDLPTLPGGYSYPAPTVPPRTNAPYLNPSSLPADFIFIVVGAVLAFVALLILTWRLTVAWQANRSVKLNTKGGPNYHSLGMDTKYHGYAAEPARVQSNHNLPDYPVRPSTGPAQSNSSLFFSPTAAAASGVRNSQRASTYLSSGYYGAQGGTH